MVGAAMVIQSWEIVLTTILIGISAYISMIIILRISGKRTLSKMNAFDLIVTVALGSALAATVVNQDVSLIEGMTAIAVLVALQYLIAWLSLHSAFFKKLIKSKPQILYYKGEYYQSAMKKERILLQEIEQAVRSNGSASMSQVLAVVLETDGTLSIIKNVSQDTDEDVLKYLNNRV
jgi:uncharacterized membrane protein YcaP (DUF421 family)